jgi:transcription elongation factor GreA
MAKASKTAGNAPRVADNTKIIMTQSALDALKAELKRRSEVLRPEIIERIAVARADGDLSENGAYQAARDEQAKNEGMIEDLGYKIEHAQVTAADKSGKIGPLSVVKVNLLPKEFLLATREMKASTDLDVYSPESPMGTALLGHKAGEEVSYLAPNGNSITITVESVRPFSE